MKRVIIFSLLLLTSHLCAIELDKLQALFSAHPFPYDLALRIHSGTTSNAEVMICCHGYGGDGRIADALKSHQVTDRHLIGFNFPDAGDKIQSNDPNQIAFGTIQELLPLFYLLKTVAVEGRVPSIHLYGFSMGGAAVINTLTILENKTFSQELATIGIHKKERTLILKALQKGCLVLDCPLKSIEEIIALRGLSPDLVLAQHRYTANQMSPITALERLKSLHHNIILYFHDPDEILSNRDDKLYIQRLQKANQKGNTEIVIGNETGGHNGFHSELWKTYSSQERS